MEIIKLLLKSHILSGIGIASIFAVIVKIDKFISDDYFIQQFYTPHSIKLLNKILIPFKHILMNLILTVLSFLTLMNYFYTIEIKKNPTHKIMIDNLIQQLQNKDFIKDSIIILAFISGFILCIQFFFVVCFDFKRNEHLFVKESKLYIYSNELKKQLTYLPKNKKIYLLQKFKQNKQTYFLAFYIKNNKASRVIIPEETINKIPIHPINRQKIFTFIDGFNKLTDNKAVLFVFIIIIPLFIGLLTQSISSVFYYLIELFIFFIPKLKEKYCNKDKINYIKTLYQTVSKNKIQWIYIIKIFSSISIGIAILLFILKKFNIIIIKTFVPTTLIVFIVSIILTFLIIRLKKE